MVQPLPYKDIEFETTSPTLGTPEGMVSQKSEDFWLTTLLETPGDAEPGYFVEVDLEFPPELHDKFEQFPPCPETLKPEVEWFSDYQKEVMEKTQASPTSEKLITHLMKHENYV